MEGNEYKLNELDLFQLAFGYRALPFPLGEWNAITRWQRLFDKKQDGFDIVKEVQQTHDQTVGFTNEFGIPCLFPVILTDPYTNKSYTLPNATIEIRGKKNIVSTSLVGCNGTVKELMGIDDYRIAIKGIIINYKDITLKNELAQLSEIWNLNKALRLTDSFSKYALQANETMIVIKDLGLPDMKGISYAQAYELDTETDINLELTLQNV